MLVGPVEMTEGDLLFFSKNELGFKLWRGSGDIDPRGQRRLRL